MTPSKKHRLVVEVESPASSSKKYKSPGIFNKNYCDLLTAITHTKILVTYFIISNKKTVKYKWHFMAARPTHYFVGSYLCFWATVCKTVRPMLSHHCLSVSPVCL